MIVEIDESLFTKMKNNSGCVLPQQWIFGGCCSFCFQIGMQNLNERDFDNAWNFNMFDCWKGYKHEKLLEAGLPHFTVNHTYNS